MQQSTSADISKKSIWKNIVGDFKGGLSATIAGLPTELNYGVILLAPLSAGFANIGVLMALYSSITAAFVCVLAGSRAGLLNGARPASTLILASLVADVVAHPFNTPHLIGAQGVILVVLATTIFAGLFQIFFGLMRLGQMIRYMPYPVLSGVTNGIALQMIMAGMPVALGMNEGESMDWSSLRPLSIVIALLCLYVTFRPGKYLSKLPIGMPALLIGTVAFYMLQAFGSQAWLGGLFTSVPSQLPSPDNALQLAGILTSPDELEQLFSRVWTYAFAISIMGSLEALITVSSADQLMNHHHTNGDRQLTAQGIANIAVGFVGGISTAPTLSRLHTSVRSGARTRLTTIIYGTSILCVLLFGMGIVSRLPAVVPATILIAVAINMIDKWNYNLIKQVLFQRSTMSLEEYHQLLGHLAIMLIVVAVAVGKGLVWAVSLGIISAMLIFVHNNIKPVVRRIYSGQYQRSLRVRRNEEVEHLMQHGQSIIVLELEGAIFFGTTAKLTPEILEAAENASYVILDLRRTTEIDATGARALEQLVKMLDASGKTLLLSHLRPEISLGRFLVRMELPKAIPLFYWFPDTDTALEYSEDQLLQDAGIDTSRGEIRELRLSETTLGADLTADQLAELQRHVQRIEHQAGDVIFRKNELGDKLYIIAYGSVSMRADDNAETNHGVRLAAFGAGIFFGEMGLMEGTPRSATAVADEYTVLYQLDRAHFETLKMHHPDITSRLLFGINVELANRLRNTTLSLMNISQL